MDIKELLKGIDIDGLNDTFEEQMRFLEKICEGQDFTEEQKAEIEKSISSVKESLSNLKT